MLRDRSYRGFSDEIGTRLSELFRDRQPEAVEVSALLRQIAAVVLPQLARAISCESGMLNRLASQSCHHDNGFAKLTLMDLLDRRFRLRLHVWPYPDSTPAETPNIHSHRFDFFSLLLFGGLQHRLWTLHDDGLLHRHYRYFPRNAGFGSLQYVGTSRLKPRAEADFQVNQCYFLPRTELHTSCPVGEPTATLFLEDRCRVKPFADVFSLRYPSDDTLPHPPPMAPSVYLDVLRHISNVGSFVPQL